MQDFSNYKAKGTVESSDSTSKAAKLYQHSHRRKALLLPFYGYSIDQHVGFTAVC